MKNRALLFDMDGVLVDVTHSYRLAIKQTAEFFLGTSVNMKEIQSYKNRGGFNGDWDLTEAIIQSGGKRVSKKVIIKKFQALYQGNHFDGLIQNEKWMLDMHVITDLIKCFKIGIVTGRMRVEAEYVLNRFKMETLFDVLITLDETPKNRKKPHPFGIIKALKELNVSNGFYFGDTVDDMKAAQAAGIIPVGILNHEDQDLGRKQKKRLMEKGAKFVLKHINDIKEVLNENGRD
jgi:HAD superfamily phosphatase